MIPATLDLARNLASAWLPLLLLVAAIYAVPWLLISGLTWLEDRKAERSNAAADEEWAAICAAYGTTPEEMRERTW